MTMKEKIKLKYDLSEKVDKMIRKLHKIKDFMNTKLIHNTFEIA